MRLDPQKARTLALHARLAGLPGLVGVIMFGFLVWVSPASSMNMTLEAETHCLTEMECHTSDSDTGCQGHLCGAHLSTTLASASTLPTLGPAAEAVYRTFTAGIRPEFDPPLLVFARDRSFRAPGP
ncbi:hypothetical protein J7426_05905 [Tropicibacter sp. R16_0]|uniref:hypothetical protein n=1 Tax=Tropicibacter sp. R16_0 TaxID=2821102 RepID=UPI001ADD3AC8|nr:hypothetical protein [Tropicibacter sp. R16_0]MBO9449781.1 hypothetical protein [Tropicibacter sp. R16_0]